MSPKRNALDFKLLHKAVKWGDELKAVKSRPDMTGSRIPHLLFKSVVVQAGKSLETSGNRRWAGRKRWWSRSKLEPFFWTGANAGNGAEIKAVLHLYWRGRHSGSPQRIV